mmetsp:Transcript_3696/g.23171  ORF Transcript_3696/g.23171 Transcript_3696/m.23171 type:complete len:882 (-) Transcript_3696:318-2963(-)|eukprot:CAMPEP_0183831524 /NCGR_PEP_ID=MMETSP0807_2-20130328/4736_1 /TAXON_ID=88271 /ORGANISM="Picocystis salinarum, Strain CCMP1897" /LENGTH=881 /DNA_ID=CAMNT_0026077037 /DNA_START=101 /DNA_END=2746 /DNA_ORIENTATION=+
MAADRREGTRNGARGLSSAHERQPQGSGTRDMRDNPRRRGLVPLGNAKSASGRAIGKTLAVPKPVNLPSIRKEHSGNDPNARLVPTTLPGAGWTKPTETTQAPPKCISSSPPAGLHVPPTIGPTALADGLPSSSASGTASLGYSNMQTPAQSTGNAGGYGVSRALGSLGMGGSTGKVAGLSMGHSMLQEQEFPSLQATAKQGNKSAADAELPSKDCTAKTFGSNWEEDERAYNGKRGPGGKFHHSGRLYSDGHPAAEGSFENTGEREDLLHPRRFHRDSTSLKGGYQGLSAQDVRASNGFFDTQPAFREEAPRSSGSQDLLKLESTPRRFYRDTPEVEEEKACRDLIHEHSQAGHGSKHSDPFLDQAQMNGSQRSPRPTQERTFREDQRAFRRDATDRFSHQRSPFKREPMVESKSPFTPDMPPPRILQRPRQLKNQEESPQDQGGSSAIEMELDQFQGNRLDGTPGSDTSAALDGSLQSSSQAAVSPLFHMRSLAPPSSNGKLQETSVVSPTPSLEINKEKDRLVQPSRGRHCLEESAPHLAKKEKETHAVNCGASTCKTSTKKQEGQEKATRGTVLKSGGAEQRRRRGGRRVREAEAMHSEQAASKAEQLEDCSTGGPRKVVASNQGNARGKAQSKGDAQTKQKKGLEKRHSVGKTEKDGPRTSKNVEKRKEKDKAEPLNSHDFLDRSTSLDQQQPGLSGFGSISAANKGSTNSLTGIPTYGADWTAGTAFGTSLSSIGGFTDAFSRSGTEANWSNYADSVDSRSFGGVRSSTETAIYDSVSKKTSSIPEVQPGPSIGNDRHISRGSEEEAEGRELLGMEKSQHATNDAEKRRTRRNPSNRGRGSRGSRQSRRRPAEASEGKRHVKNVGPTASEASAGK